MATTGVKAVVAVTLTSVVATMVAGTSTTAATASPSIDDAAAIAEIIENYDAVAFDGVGSFKGRDNSGLPESLEAGFQLGQVRVVAGTSTTQPQTSAGIIDYGTTAEGYRVVAASDGEGMDRFGILIDDADESHVAMDVELPAGADVVNEETGAISITTPDATTTIAPATAVDGDGRAVPARYRIVGEQLLLDVDLAGATLPVFVDPVSSNYWWGHRDWYSRSEVRAYAGWWSVIRIVQRACGGNLACLGVVGGYVNWIYGTWQYAKNNNMCLTFDQLWTGQITSIRAYGCNWG